MVQFVGGLVTRSASKTANEFSLCTFLARLSFTLITCTFVCQLKPKALTTMLGVQAPNFFVGMWSESAKVFSRELSPGGDTCSQLGQIIFMRSWNLQMLQTAG